MSKYGDQSLDPKDWETQPQSDIPFVPHPEESANILERAGWTHRWNTLLNCREWQYFDDPWEKSTPRIEARIRGNIRRVDAMHGNDNASPFNVRPRIIAMQSIWGEVTVGLDAWPDQQYTPGYPLNGEPLPLDHAILPWYAWLQRRYLPGSGSVWQPEIVVKPGSALLPIDIAHYLTDVFYVMPLSLSGGATGRRSRRVKHQEPDKPIVINTDDAGIELPDPYHGLASAIHWYNVDPYLVMADIVEAEPVKERLVSEFAGGIAEGIATKMFGDGKTIAEFLVAMEHFEDESAAIRATAKGEWKAYEGEVTYCLREWYGWEKKSPGRQHLRRWYAPEENEDG